MVAAAAAVCACGLRGAEGGLFGHAFAGAPRGLAPSVAESRGVAAVARPAAASGEAAPTGRRGAAVAGAVMLGLGLGSFTRPEGAHAAVTAKDKERIKKGVEQIRYLLNNWEEATTVCNPECSRSPDAVRGYLGLRSLEDPLFQIEKVFVRSQNDVDPNMTDDYQEAVEGWNSAVAGVNGEAYISSFGEYNPGGGQAQVEKYIERSRDQAKRAQGYLETIAKSLGIEV